MRSPKTKGTPIDAARIRGWEDRFRFYRASPGSNEINNWLNRFTQRDRDLAARVLDCVEVISEATIQLGYKQALESIEGWHRLSTKREGKWVFTGFGKPSESGMSMLRVFREANGLTAHVHDGLFRHTTEIPSLKLSAEDTIIVVDDFSGSGQQICKRWPTLQELIASEARCFIILTAATANAIVKVEEETGVSVLTKVRIQPNEDIFFGRRFDDADKQILLKYCRQADAKNPQGFNKCGLLYVLSHKTPNNSIPILHVNHNNWIGLFPRNLQQSLD